MMAVDTRDLIGTGSLAIVLVCVIGYGWWTGRAAAPQPIAQEPPGSVAPDYSNPVGSNMTFANNGDAANSATPNIVPLTDQFVPNYIYSNIQTRTSSLPAMPLDAGMPNANTGYGGSSWGWIDQF